MDDSCWLDAKGVLLADKESILRGYDAVAALVGMAARDELLATEVEHLWWGGGGERVVRRGVLLACC